jgi:hypothetical protein
MEGIVACFWLHLVDGGHWGRFSSRYRYCGFICFHPLLSLRCDHLEILLLDTDLERTFILKAYMKWLCYSGYFVVMHSESWSFIRWWKHFKRNIFTVKLPSLTGIGIQLLLWPEYQYIGNKCGNVLQWNLDLSFPDISFSQIHRSISVVPEQILFKLWK